MVFRYSAQNYSNANSSISIKIQLKSFKVDLIHINSEPDNDTVSYGIDLSEYYLNVEWDILSVPAERHVKTYPCCPEPYPGTKQCFMFE